MVDSRAAKGLIGTHPWVLRPGSALDGIGPFPHRDRGSHTLPHLVALVRSGGYVVISANERHCLEPGFEEVPRLLGVTTSTSSAGMRTAMAASTG